MMWALFKNQKEIKVNEKYYLLIKDKWAKKMSDLTCDLSKQSLVFCLFLFVIVSAGMSIYNVYNGFYSREKTVVIEKKSISTFVVVEPDLNINTQRILSKAEFENIIRINFYLESLKQSKKGQIIYDSIQNYRPGLLDSLVFIENYYKINFKK